MSLTGRDRAVLERVLANEADMAFRRRVPILLDYLELDDGDRVLDCGCGMGFWLFAMRRLRRLELVGVDADPGRLEWAEREHVDATLVQGDAQKLPFDDDSFDGVLMTEVLEHLPDDRSALFEAKRVLRPGGVLAISVPNARYPFWWDPISAVRDRLGLAPIRSGPVVGIWTNHERLYTAAELASRVSEAGLEIERVEETTHYCFPFIHFLVYGIGKPLVERDLLPARLRRSADRFQGESNPAGALDPFNAVRSAFRLVDRLNDRPGAQDKRTFLNVLLKARNPA